MSIKNIYNWMNDIANKEPKSFAEYFYSDIMDYVFPENYDDVQELADEILLSGCKRQLLLSCTSESDVNKWMNIVASEIIMRINTEEIISDFLSE